MEQVVIVGAGLGGVRTAESLRAEGFAGQITLVGDELHQPYDRPPLSKQVLAGSWSEERALLHRGDLAELDVSVHLGRSVIGVDSTAVHLDDGSQLPYHA